MNQGHPPIVSARLLLILLAIIAIIASSLVLSYFSFQWTRDIRSRMDQLMEEDRQRVARDVDRSLQEGVRTLEDSILDEVHALPPEALPDSLSNLKANHPVIRELFLLDRNFEPIYPAHPAGALGSVPAAAPAPSEPEAPLEPALGLLRKAQEAEFVENAPADAIPIYEQFEAQALSLRQRAGAAMAVAGCLFKLKRFKEASEQYQRALQRYNLRLMDPSLALLAAYQAALSLQRAGDLAGAADQYVALYEEIVEGRSTETDQHRIEFFRARTAQALQQLQQSPDMPGELKERAARIRERDQFLTDLRSWLIVKLKADAAKADVDARHFFHLSGDSPGPEPHLVAYTLLRKRGEKNWHTLFGFTYNLQGLLEQVIGPKLREEIERLGRRCALAVEDLNEKRLLGEELPERFITRRTMGSLFPFWQVAVTERPSEHADVEYYGRQLTWFYASINLVLLGVILAGVAVVIRDITHQQRLARLQREFVSSVSHELKTPLALIRMFGEMLYLGRVRSPEKQQEYYQIITRESERLTHLINNVLDFSRIDAGRKQYSFHTGDLTEVVRSTVEAYALTLRRQGFELDIHLDRLPPMWFDADAVSQSLLNLLSNAAKYSRERKKIGVLLRREGGQALLSVSDQGIGIDPAEIPKIFRKFHRADDPLVRETQGAGLGLSIVRHAAEAHGGQVTVESTKGEGSTFTILLPIRAAPQPGQEASADQRRA